MVSTISYIGISKTRMVKHIIIEKDIFLCPFDFHIICKQSIPDIMDQENLYSLISMFYENVNSLFRFCKLLKMKAHSV